MNGFMGGNEIKGIVKSESKTVNKPYRKKLLSQPQDKQESKVLGIMGLK